jgi:hypothetical protein
MKYIVDMADDPCSRSPTPTVADVIWLVLAHPKLDIIFYVYGVLVFFGGFS